MDRSQALPQSPPSPWRFVPSLYFAQGLPFVTVTMLSVVMFTSMGVSNVQMAFWTSFLHLPWVIKPLWSPFVEVWLPKRRWICDCQLLLGLLCLALGSALPLPSFFLISIFILYSMALLSATHDIAADGFYILGLNSKQQASFVGIRSTAFRVALIFGQGGLVWFCGTLQQSLPIAESWAVSFSSLGAILLALGLWHRMTLPYPADDHPAPSTPVWPVLRSFFQKSQIHWALAFLLLYRLGEAQLSKMAVPFLLAPPADGGLGLSVEEVGLLMGGFGVGALLAGGILGGLTLSRWGLRSCFFPFWAALNLPNLLYLYLAYTQPSSRLIIGCCITVEQFGYGLGFAAYMLYMLHLAGDGEWKTSHYALATGFMALGLMLPGMVSGLVQEQVGYLGFFSWVMLCTLPVLAVIPRLRIN